MSDKWINNVGEILKSKSGNLYIKITNESGLKLEEGRTINITPYKKKIESMVERGIMDQAKADNILEKRSFVKYVLDVPPKKDN